MRTYIVDTFTKTPFRGNPAAVCLVDASLSPGSMQSMATGFNLPVTAFILERAAGAYDIRYYTTTTEITACGHATLGAAATAFDLHSLNKASFDTITGLTINVGIDNGMIRMNYPVYTPTEMKVSTKLLSCLGLNEGETLGYCEQLETLFVRTGAEQLRNCKPDFYGMMQAAPANVIEIVITSRSDDANYDYLLRSFCPWIGIDEDPVTGSVHSILAPYWNKELNSEKLRAFQASEQGGEPVLEVSNDKVVLAGHYVIRSRHENT